jgi:hypothetical protein
MGGGGSSHAKAGAPSFAFEVLPRMVPLSRHDVTADMRAIASAAEALAAMRRPGGGEAQPMAKRMRVGLSAA